MRITHVSFSSSGGAGNAARRLVTAQQSHGLDAVLVSITSRDVLGLWNRHPVVFLTAVFDYAAVRQRTSDSLFTVCRATARGGPELSGDVLHLHWSPGIIEIETVARSLDLGMPVVTTLHDFWPLTGGCHFTQGCTEYARSCDSCPQARRLFYPMVKSAYQEKSKVLLSERHHLIAPSRWILNRALQHPSISEDRIHHIPNMLDRKLSPERATAATHTQGRRESSFTIGFVAARINEPRKGLKTLVRACSELHRDGHDFVLHTVGSGSPDRSHPWWSHLGPISDESNLAEFYSDCDLIVVPSSEDNSPTVVLEAGQSRTPVAVTENSGGGEFVEHGETGFVFGSETDLIGVLRSAIASQSELPSMGATLQRRIADELDETRLIRRYTELYRSLLLSSGKDLT